MQEIIDIEREPITAELDGDDVLFYLNAGEYVRVSIGSLRDILKMVDMVDEE